jgi:hypothetical protein
VLGPSTAKSRFEAAARRGLTPFIGRKRESQALDASWQAAAGGHGHVVLVVGDAGIGKSRLIHEFRRRVDTPDVHSLLAACTAQGRDSAFHSILDLVGQILGFATERRPAERRARVDTALATLGDTAAGAAPLLARLLGLPLGASETKSDLPPEGERRRLIAALVGLLLAQGREVPAVLVVEDLHWADASTVEVLDDLMRRVHTAPLLVILSTRPGFEHEWSERPIRSRSNGRRRRTPPAGRAMTARGASGHRRRPRTTTDGVRSSSSSAAESPVGQLLARARPRSAPT